MAAPAKINSKVPGVLRGTATVACTRTSHLRGDGATKTTTRETERFDANYWVDFAKKVEGFRKTIEGRGCSATVIDITLDDQKPQTPTKPQADANLKADNYQKLRDQCVKSGRRDCDGQGR